MPFLPIMRWFASMSPLGAGSALSKAPLCKGSCLRSRLRGCRLTARGSGLPAWWGRSAGPDFSPMRNRGKNRLGRSPLRTSLGYEARTASRLCSARDSCCGSCYFHHIRLSWQLALWLGGFHIRAYPDQAAFPPPGARPPATGDSCTPG